MRLYQNEEVRRKVIKENIRLLAGNRLVSQEEIDRRTDAIMKDQNKLDLHKRAIAIGDNFEKRFALLQSLKKDYQKKTGNKQNLHGLDRVAIFMFRMDGSEASREYNARLYLALNDQEKASEIFSGLLSDFMRNFNPNDALLDTPEKIFNKYAENPEYYEIMRDLPNVLGKYTLNPECEKLYNDYKVMFQNVSGRMSSAREVFASDVFITTDEADTDTLVNHMAGLSEILADNLEGVDEKLVIEAGKDKRSMDAITNQMSYSALTHEVLDGLNPEFSFPQRDAGLFYSPKLDGKRMNYTLFDAVKNSKNGKIVRFSENTDAENEKNLLPALKPVLLTGNVHDEVRSVYRELKNQAQLLKETENRSSHKNDAYTALRDGLDRLFQHHSDPEQLDTRMFITQAKAIKPLADAYLEFRQNSKKSSATERRLNIGRTISGLTEFPEIEKKMVGEPRPIEDVTGFAEPEEDPLNTSFIYDGTGEEFAIKEGYLRNEDGTYPDELEKPQKKATDDSALSDDRKFHKASPATQAQPASGNSQPKKMDVIREDEEEDEEDEDEQVKDPLNIMDDAEDEHFEDNYLRLIGEFASVKLQHDTDVLNDQDGDLVRNDVYYDLSIDDVAKYYRLREGADNVNHDMLMQIFKQVSPSAYIKAMFTGEKADMDREFASLDQNTKGFVSGRDGAKQVYDGMASLSPMERVLKFTDYVAKDEKMMDSYSRILGLALWQKYKVLESTQNCAAFMRASENAPDANVDFGKLSWKPELVQKPEEYFEKEKCPAGDKIDAIIAHTNNEQVYHALVSSKQILVSTSDQGRDKVTQVTEEKPHMDYHGENHVTKEFIFSHKPELVNIMGMDHSLVTLKKITPENVKRVHDFVDEELEREPIVFPEEFKHNFMDVYNYMKQNADDFRLDTYKPEAAKKYYAFLGLVDARKKVDGIISHAGEGKLSDADQKNLVQAVNDYNRIDAKIGHLLEMLQHAFPMDHVTPNLMGSREKDLPLKYRSNMGCARINEMWQLIGFTDAFKIPVEELLNNPIEAVRKAERQVNATSFGGDILNKDVNFATLWSEFSLNSENQLGKVQKLQGITRAIVPLYRMGSNLDGFMDRVLPLEMLERGCNYEIVTAQYLGAKDYIERNPAEIMKMLLAAEPKDRKLETMIPNFIDPASGKGADFNVTEYMRSKNNYAEVALRASEALDNLAEAPFAATMKGAIASLFTEVLADATEHAPLFGDAFRRLAAGKQLTATMKVNLQSFRDFSTALASGDMERASEIKNNLARQYDSRNLWAKTFYSSVENQSGLLDLYDELLRQHAPEQAEEPEDDGKLQHKNLEVIDENKELNKTLDHINPKEDDDEDEFELVVNGKGINDNENPLIQPADNKNPLIQQIVIHDEDPKDNEKDRMPVGNNGDPQQGPEKNKGPEKKEDDDISLDGLF